MRRFFQTLKKKRIYKKRISSKEYDLIKDISALADELDRPCLSDCGDGFKQATFFGVGRESFDGIISKLESRGFVGYFENEMNGNPFAVLTAESVMVYISYISYQKLSAFGIKKSMITNVIKDFCRSHCIYSSDELVTHINISA